MTRLVRNLVALAMVLAGAIAFGGMANAQSCSSSVDQMNFGTVRTSQFPNSGGVSTITVVCDGTPGEIIRLCPSVQGGDIVNTTSAAYTIHVALFNDATFLVPLQTGIDVLIGGTGTGHATQTVYGRASLNSASIKSGLHTAIISLGLTGSYLSAGAPQCATAAGVPAAAFRASVAGPVVKRTATMPVARR